MTSPRRKLEHYPDLADCFAMTPQRRLALARSHRPLERPLETLTPFTSAQCLCGSQKPCSADELPEQPAPKLPVFRERDAAPRRQTPASRRPSSADEQKRPLTSAVDARLGPSRASHAGDPYRNTWGVRYSCFHTQRAFPPS